MKKITYSTLLIASLFLMVSFVMVGSTDTRSLGKFHALSVSSGIAVTLVHGSSHQAVVTTEGVEASEILTEVSNGELKIKYKKNNNWGKKKRKVNVTVHYSSLDEISVSSGSSVKSEDQLSSDDLDVDVSSGASCQLDIDCGKLTVDVSSGASLMLTGKCSSQNVDVSSGASYKAEGLSSQSASVEASSGASAKVWASDNLTASASSGGSVRYKGEPKNKTVDKSRSGSVKKA